MSSRAERRRALDAELAEISREEQREKRKARDVARAAARQWSFNETVLRTVLIIHALCESGYNYVLDVENEDRGMPGLEGFAFAGRHLRQLLPDRQQAQPAKEPWRIR